MLSTKHIAEFLIRLWGRNIDYTISDRQGKDSKVQSATNHSAPRAIPKGRRVRSTRLWD